MSEGEEIEVYSPLNTEFLIYQYMTYGNSSLQRKQQLEQLTSIDQSHAQKMIDYAEKFWKLYKFHQEGIRFLRLASSLEGYNKEKIIPTLWMILDSIDRSKLRNQFLAACRYISKIITVKDLPKTFNLATFSVIRMLNQSEINNEMKSQLADSFGDCLSKPINQKLPSFHYAKLYSMIIPKDIFIEKVLPKIERQLLRSAESYMEIATRVMPNFDFEVTQRSLAQTLLNLISNKAGKTKAPQLMVFASKCYNQDDLYKAGLTTLKACSNFESKGILANAFTHFNAKNISDVTLQLLFQQIKVERQADVQNPLITSTIAACDRIIPYFKEMTVTQTNIGAICTVLFNCSKSDDVVAFIHPHFQLSPHSVARVLIQQGVSLTAEESAALLTPTKLINDKFEALLLNGQAEQCVGIFLEAPKQFLNNALAIPEKTLGPFVDLLVLNPNVSDDILLKFTPKVKKSPSSFSHLTVSLLWPTKASEKDVPQLLELLTLRSNMAGRSLSEIGFTKEQYNYVKEKIDAYFDNALTQEELNILLCQEEIDLQHPSAEKYAEMKEEIAHPTARTNLPQLKKQFEKQKSKVIATQEQIKKELNETKVQPVLDVIHLLIHHFKNERKPVTASLTSFTLDLLKLKDIPTFTNDVENCLFSCLTRVPAFRTMPRTILAILTHDNDTLDTEMLKYLVPTGQLSDVLLHMVASNLPALLTNKQFAEKFCDTKAITNETSIDILLPIYLDHANYQQSIYDFTVALCCDIPASRIPLVFDHLLDNDMKIRQCALECISVCNFDIEPTPFFICELHVHAVSDELGLNLLSNINRELTLDEITESYTKLFNRNSTDESLQKDIGISYGLIMSNKKNEAGNFLIPLYSQNNQKTESYNVPVQNNVRIAVSYSLAELKPITPACIDFITLTGLKDSVDVVRQNMMVVCEFYISSFQKEDIPDLFKRFYEPLSLPPVASVDNNRLRCCLVSLCMKIVDLDYEQYGQTLFDALMKFDVRSQYDDLRDVCAKNISKLAKKKGVKEIPALIEQLKATRDNQNTFDKLLGYAYSYCALLHAQGVSSLRGGIFDTTDTLSKSKNEQDRCLACFIFAGLSFMFGAILEPSLPRVLPVLLTLFGDKAQIVCEAAEKAIQSIVKNLTHACVERVLPFALNQAENDSSWRVQQAAILLVEAVLKNKPKNISKFVPNIVSSLGIALKSATSSVRQTAQETIGLIRSNISNEAVAEIFPFLVNAISDPSKLSIAIDKITHLNLVQRLDTTDLSLIIPIVANGCATSGQQLKTDSLKILGQLPNIAIDSAVDQFSDEIVPPLMSGVGDPAPNTRAISAASLSSVVTCFTSDKYDAIMKKLIEEMTTKSTFSERQGTAQAIASLIKTKGVSGLQDQLQSFVDLAKTSKDIKVREGYVSLLGFLSHFFGEDFSIGYNMSIEAVLDACADPNDAIRTVGLRSASLIAKTFSKSHPHLILEPYFACALKENWRQRLCAVNFMKSFVMATTDTTEADDKGIRNIGELLEKLESAVDHDLLYPAVITLFILAADPVPTVSKEAQTVWKQVIPNTNLFLRNTMDILLERISSFTHSEFEVVRTVGASAMAWSIRKLKTIFLKKCFTVIEEQLQEDDVDAVHGAVLSIHLMIDCLNQDNKLFACELLAPYLSSPFPLVRQEALEAFVEMRSSLGDQGQREVSIQLVQYVYQKASTDSDVSYLSGLLGILGYHAMIDLTRKILQRPLDEQRPIVAQRIISASGEALDEVMGTFSERMISMAAHPPTEKDGAISIGIANHIIDVLSEKNRQVFSSRLVENMRSQQPQNRQASIVIGGYLLKQVSTSFNEIVKSLVRASLYLFDDPLDVIQSKAIESISGISKSIPIDEIPQLLKEISDTLESLCTATKVRAFEKPESFEALNLILEDGFKTHDESAVHSACTILATVVPQLSEPPVTTRKLLANCVFALQLFTGTALQMKILNGSRALFERAQSERQILVNSLPMAYIRLFRSGKLDLQSSAADTLCCYARKISAPIIVIRCLLQIAKTQIQNVSSTVINALIRIIKTIQLKSEECEECIEAFTPLLRNHKIAMRELSAYAIAVSLLSSPNEFAIDKALHGGIFLFDNDDNTHTSMIIANELLKSNKTQILDQLMPFVEKLLDQWAKSTSEQVMSIFPKICITLILCNPSLIEQYMNYIQTIFDDGEAEQQVVACQEIHRLVTILKNIDHDHVVLILNCLMNAQLYGSPAVQSASSTTLFDLFHLDEKDDNQLQELSNMSSDPESAYQSFKTIIEQVQNDRANQMNAK